MKYFHLLLDIKFQNVLLDFYNSLEEVLDKDDNEILSLIFLENEFLDSEMPCNYPQYIIVTKKKSDKSVIDEIFYDLQDKHGWPYGHYFVNSYSRKNIFSLEELENGLKVDETYLDLNDIEKVIKKDYIKLVESNEYNLDGLLEKAFNKIKSKVQEIEAKLSINNINDSIKKFIDEYSSNEMKGVNIAVTNDFCRERGNSKTYETEVLMDIKKALGLYINDKDAPKRHMLYGRLNGCGKSQYMFSIMGYLYRHNYPFILKELFYFHYNEFLKDENTEDEKYKYYKLIKDRELTEETNTEWVLKLAREIEEKTGKKPVIFIDEEDVNFQNLKEYFIIYADKDIQRQIDNTEWVIHDIIRKDFIDSEYVKIVLSDEINNIELFNEVQNLQEVIEIISDNSKLPLYSNGRCSVYHAKRLLSLSLLEGVKRYFNGEKLFINSEDVYKWKDYYWNKFMPKFGLTDDFHCEYIIYDGKNIECDPYVRFDVEGLIKKNS